MTGSADAVLHLPWRFLGLHHLIEEGVALRHLVLDLAQKLPLLLPIRSMIRVILLLLVQRRLPICLNCMHVSQVVVLLLRI